ncbi:MAG: response regulator [Patescibacteria group bacterium]
MKNNKPAILVVDDEDVKRTAVSEALREAQFTVIEAMDGEMGLEMALTQHPRLILLDIVMPKMDGLEMLKALRADEWGKTVHVMLLTGYADPEKVATALKYGANDYLLKTSYDLDGIVGEVQRKLGLA